jgi:hypothetical protein
MHSPAINHNQLLGQLPSQMTTQMATQLPIQSVNQTIVVYSKYSQKSTLLIQSVANAGLGHFKTICIDNEQIRKKLQSSKKINITMVPCILVLYSTGVVEMYEGASAFEYINMQIQQLLPPVQPIQQQRVHYQEPIEEIVDHEPPKIAVTKRKEKPPMRPNPKISHEPIDEEAVTSLLDDDLDDELTEISKPPVAVRNGINGYDITTRYGEEDQDQISEQPPQVSISNASTVKKSKLNESIAMMQMERDREEELKSQNKRYVKEKM